MMNSKSNKMTEMSTTMNDLPEETITEILQYLLHEEVLRLSVVNRKWYNASRHPRLLGKLFLWDKWLINYEKNHRLQKFLEVHPPNSEQFPFTEVKVTALSKTEWQVMEYVEKHQQLVRKLTLNIARNESSLSDHVTSEQLSSTLGKLGNLQYLSMEFQCIKFTAYIVGNVGSCINLHRQDAFSLRNGEIRTLELSGCLNGITEHLRHLPLCLSKLKLLKLTIDVLECSTFLRNEVTSVLLLKAIEKVVEEIPELKVELNFLCLTSSRNSDQLRFMRNLVDKDIFPKERVTIHTFGLKLEIIPYDLLQNFGRMHTDIKVLSLVQIENGGLTKYRMVATYWKDLEELVLHNCNVQFFLNYFKDCTNLQRLQIIYTGIAPIDLYFLSICNQPLQFPKMKFVMLLNVGFTRFIIDTISFQNLLLSCRNLEKLYIGNTKFAGASGEIPLIIRIACPNLRELTLDTDITDFFGDTNYMPISHMSELTSLSLSSCQKIHDHHLESFQLSRLTELCLEELKFVSMQGFQQFFKQSPFIEYLKLKNCCVTDEIIEIISMKLKYLKALDIRGGNLLSEKSIDVLVKNSKSIKFIKIEINDIPKNDQTFELIRQKVIKVFATVSYKGKLKEITPDMIDTLKITNTRRQTLRPRKRKHED